MAFYIPDHIQPLFPHPLLSDSSGLLAITADLKLDQLKLAYRFGIFPWYVPDESVHWYFPKPRSVLYPDELRIQKSMRPLLAGQRFTWTLDRAFDRVIHQCAIAGNRMSEGSWIGQEIIHQYTTLHHQKLAHSIEVWQQGELVGGFYGVWLGRVFFGESMFSLVSNASKYGFIQFINYYSSKGKINLVDCQMETDHFNRLGARNISGIEFLEHLRKNID